MNYWTVLQACFATKKIFGRVRPVIFIRIFTPNETYIRYIYRTNRGIRVVNSNSCKFHRKSSFGYTPAHNQLIDSLMWNANKNDAKYVREFFRNAKDHPPTQSVFIGEKTHADYLGISHIRLYRDCVHTYEFLTHIERKK